MFREASARLLGSTGSLVPSSSAALPLRVAQLCEAPHRLPKCKSGVSRHEMDADHPGAPSAQFRPEPISSLSDPAGKGNGDAQLCKQEECLCDLNSDLNLPTRCEYLAPAVGLPAHL